MPRPVSLSGLRRNSTRLRRRTGDNGSTLNFQEKEEEFYRILDKIETQLFKDIDRGQKMCTLFLRVASALINGLAALILEEAHQSGIQIVFTQIFNLNSTTFDEAMRQIENAVYWAKRNLNLKQPSTSRLGGIMPDRRVTDAELLSFVRDARTLLQNKTITGTSLAFANSCQAYEASMILKAHLPEEKFNRLRNEIIEHEKEVKGANRDVHVVETAIRQLEQMESEIRSVKLSEPEEKVVKIAENDIARYIRETAKVVNEMRNTGGIDEMNKARRTKRHEKRVDPSGTTQAGLAPTRRFPFRRLTRIGSRGSSGYRYRASQLLDRSGRKGK